MSKDSPLARARVAIQKGDLDAGVKALREAARLAGADFKVWMELADALWANFQFEEALDILGQVVGLCPDETSPAVLAAKRMFTLGRIADSARWLTVALDRDPANGAIRRMLAELRDREGKLGDAETLAREVLANDPRDALAARSLAHTLRRMGRVAEAREVLSRHLRDNPGREDWRLNYELAACLDGAGDCPGAMDALNLAKRQLRSVADPLLVQWRCRARRREEFAAALDRATFECWRLDAESSSTPMRLALLAGHPRSGTTLLERMLAAHSEVVTTDETGVLRSQFVEPIVLEAATTEHALAEVNGFETDQLAAGRAVYVRATEAHVGRRLGASLLIEKDPLATQDLGMILRLLPESRVIFPLRDPRDVCVSFYFTLVPLNADSAPALDWASTCASVALSLRLWRHWKRVLPQTWTEMRYEELVRAPEGAMRSLAGVLGLSWERGMLAPVVAGDRGVRSPTYADVAQPLHARSVGRWTRYAEWLEPHWEPLRDLMGEFGYGS